MCKNGLCTPGQTQASYPVVRCITIKMLRRHVRRRISLDAQDAEYARWPAKYTRPLLIIAMLLDVAADNNKILQAQHTYLFLSVTQTVVLFNLNTASDDVAHHLR